jgi:phosphoribosylformylglycinamidine synthase
MKAAVITFPGSNCDDDCRYALARCCGFDVTMLWHKDSPALGEFDLVALPGGFSYGDYLRCGAMASLSPIMAQVKEYAGRGGRVIGICNGFQILCESGLLPGALARNEGLRFVCQDVYCRVESAENPWTRGLGAGQTLRLPIAHGDGRYVVPEADLPELERNGQIVLRYSTADGKVTPEGNPNGSLFGIAGICNAAKNVFGLMPHPERATDLRGGDGMKLWQAAISGGKSA